MEDYVTKEQLTDKLENQEKLFKDLINLQEKNYRSFLDSFMKSTNDRVDKFMIGTAKELESLKNSLEYTQKDTHEIQKQLAESKSDLADLHAIAETHKSQIKQLFDQTDYLENQSRRNNLRIDGIKENPMETWSQTEAKVRDLIKTSLSLDPTKIEIERAHRTGRSQDTENQGQRPRTVVVKFMRFKDREDIRNSSKKLKGSGVFISEDFSTRVIQARKELWPKVKAEREKGNYAYLSYDKIVVRPPKTT